MKTLTKELQEKITPQGAVDLLKQGNERFLQNQKADRDLLQQVKETQNGQAPFAAIVSCMDSRTSAELIFDLGLGDIFSIRVAGNIINDDVLGSLEYATKVVGSKLIVILGHTKCGAVKGACDHVKLGHLSGLLAKIEAAVQAETQTQQDRTAANAEFVENVSRLNVEKTVAEVLRQSDIIKDLVHAGEVGIVGAMYDVNTGNVEFYHNTFLDRAPAQSESQVS